MSAPQTPPDARAVVGLNGANYYILQAPNSTKIRSRIYEDGWGMVEYVGDARELTPAAYVVYNQDGTKRIILTLDTAGKLQAHGFDDEAGDWEVGSKIAAAHPQTSITAIHDGHLLHVWYQDPDGNLRQSVSDGYMGSWKPAEKQLPDVKAVPGTGLSATIVGNKLSLFYGNQDFSIHQLSFDGNDWTDSLVKNTDDVMPLARINATATPGPAPQVNICFYTRTGELVEVNVNTQQRVKQGKLSDSGELIPESTKQFGIIGLFSAFFGFPVSISINPARCWVCGGDIWIRAGTTSTDPCKCWGNRRRADGNGSGDGRRRPVSPERPQ